MEPRVGDGEKWTNGKFGKLNQWKTPGFCWYEIVIEIFCFCQHLENWRPKLCGGLVIWNFSIWLIFMKWWPFFNFFIMANTDILFPSTLGKLETQTLGGGGGNLKFSCMINIFTKWWPFFNFFIMADADILFLSTLEKPETQSLGGGW